MDRQTVALLGGTGFIGSRLVNALIESGKQVRIGTRRRDHARHLQMLPVEIVGSKRSTRARSRASSPVRTRRSTWSACCTAAAARHTAWLRARARHAAGRARDRLHRGGRAARAAHERARRRFAWREHVPALEGRRRGRAACDRGDRFARADDLPPVGRVRPRRCVPQHVREPAALGARAAARDARRALPAGVRRRCRARVRQHARSRGRTRQDLRTRRPDRLHARAAGALLRHAGRPPGTHRAAARRACAAAGERVRMPARRLRAHARQSRDDVGAERAVGAARAGARDLARESRKHRARVSRPGRAAPGSTGSARAARPATSSFPPSRFPEHRHETRHWRQELLVVVDAPVAAARAFRHPVRRNRDRAAPR